MAISTNDPAVFWAEYEREIGEKVIAHALGRYLTGWDEFPVPLWGLLIATDAGFRFHHFPHEGWIQAMSRLAGGGGDSPVEKTLFLPASRIRAAEFRAEKSWLRNLVFARPPTLVLRYLREDGGEGRFIAESDKSAASVAVALAALLPTT